MFFQEKPDKTKPILEHLKTNAGHKQDDQHAISTQNQLMRIAEGLSNESLYKHPIFVFTDVNPLFMQQECFYKAFYRFFVSYMNLKLIKNNQFFIGFSFIWVISIDTLNISFRLHKGSKLRRLYNEISGSNLRLLFLTFFV